MLMNSLDLLVSFVCPFSIYVTGLPCCSDEGGASTGARGRSGSIRRDRLNSSEENPVVLRRPKRTKRTKLQRQSTFIRREVESLPTFWPVFIVFISIAQVRVHS